MLTLRIKTLLSVVVVSLLTMDALSAAPQQQSSRRRARSHAHVTQSAGLNEQSARASWTPVRRGQTRPAQKPLQTVGIDDVRNVKLNDHIVQAQALADPAPVPETVMELPIRENLDGQIMAEPHDTHIEGLPIYEGSELACDAFPSGACGCGSIGCDGGCDSLSCGSCGSGDCTTCGELCSPEPWRPYITLSVPQDGWVSFEYLAWWQDGLELPPLVTSSVGTAVPATQAGVLGVSGTQTLFGGGDVLEDAFDGGRLKFGIWLDRRHTWGIGAEFFRLSGDTESFSLDQTNNSILARPFFNTLTGLNDSELVAFPGILDGQVTARATSRLSGAGVHLRSLRACDEGCTNGLICSSGQFCSRTEALIGYRFLQLEEGVTVTESLQSTAPVGSFDITDRFETRNQFNGFDLGWSYRRTRGFWTFDSQIRLAIGNNRQTVRINGSTTINDPTATPTVQTFDGGLLAQTSNIGEFKQNEFAIVPEFNANLGYQLTDHWRAFVGYTFIYWSNVVRPGNQISLDLNPNLLPPQATPVVGAQRPGFQFDTTDFWVQGINVGAEYRW